MYILELPQCSKWGSIGAVSVTVLENLSMFIISRHVWSLPDTLQQLPETSALERQAQRCDDVHHCVLSQQDSWFWVCVCVCASMCVCMHVPVDGPPNTSQYYIITITILYSRIVVQPKWLAECIFNCTFAALGVPELVMKCFYSKRTMHGFPDTRLLSSPSVHGNTIQCNASQYRIRIYIP